MGDFLGGLGTALRRIGSLGRYGRKLKNEAEREREAANALIEQNTATAQSMFDRDYGQSALSDLAADPLDVLAQRRSMSGLQGVGDRYNALSRTGYTDLDRQALEQGFGQARREEQSQRQAALSAAARRGDTSGGNALLGSLMAQQGGANRASDQATNVALEGRRRAMDALAQYGSTQGQLYGMASGMRSQGVNEQAQRGGAIDAFNQWSAGQRSNDAAMLMNARSGQAQTNVDAANRIQGQLDNSGQVAQDVITGVASGGSSLAAQGATGAGGNVVSSSNKSAGGISLANPPGQPQAYQPPGGGGMNKSMANGPTIATPTGGGSLTARALGATGFGAQQPRRPRRNPITTR